MKKYLMIMPFLGLFLYNVSFAKVYDVMITNPYVYFGIPQPINMDGIPVDGNYSTIPVASGLICDLTRIGIKKVFHNR
jgi:hypothetical protein